jgi:predicted RNase H-like HicB family nuclease
MNRFMTLEYWRDGSWFVGRLQEMPGVFSQGETLADLEENIRDAYNLVIEDQRESARPDAQLKEIEIAG